VGCRHEPPASPVEQGEATAPSISVINWLTAGWVTLRSDAAPVAVPVCMTARKPSICRNLSLTVMRGLMGAEQVLLMSHN